MTPAQAKANARWRWTIGGTCRCGRLMRGDNRSDLCTPCQRAHPKEARQRREAKFAAEDALWNAPEPKGLLRP